ncbi:Nitric oxide dioxygenase [Stanieria cyanosphaera PCC 7437]|uniref:Nitric oxide dioxygenase n=1 Tax=Stanieria cyanosphaera (strain ATCC 29371 / PCC 7437) TaxID=111780 RepID=K9XUE4_STAC7|nr:globin domain-containing protein [Stanieria cyanosphaera]AFZ35292.1 Nitric oxide dioxygenase [Stanieria cyanosphaera PCC 7437]
MSNGLASVNNSFTATLKDLIEYPKQGILSKVLLKDNNCQYTLFCLAKGTEIDEHTSTRNAVVTVIEGQGILTLNNEEIALNSGVFVFMPANAPHALQAKENLAFLLTLSEHPHPKNQVSQKTIDIVKSTAPLLKQHGEKITKKMYEIMFRNHPEVKEQFDMSAQANGSQPAKLATAVYSYATQIDNLSALQSMVEKIAHRHVATYVQPEQYAIVGESLLQAIKDVLGDAATKEVMTAWTEAYQVLAEVFINREQQIYCRNNS